jgi:hypothetical protein
VVPNLSFLLYNVVAQLVEALRYKPDGREVRFPVVSFEFFIEIVLLSPHYGPGFDSTSNRYEYQEYFLGVKAAGA